MKEINTNKWKDVLCLWIGRLNSVNMSIVLRAVERFKSIYRKVPEEFFFYRNRKSNVEIYKQLQRT